MAAKAKTTKRPPRKRDRAKQGHLEGMAPPTIREIEAAADNYREMRDARMAYLEKEVEAKAILNRVMKDHDLNVYEYDGWLVTRTLTEGVKVGRKRPEGVEETNGHAEE